MRKIFIQRELKYTERIPSKVPLPCDLAGAMHSARAVSGKWNKSRAARLLGWDPDTLTARLRDRGWIEQEIPGDDPWSEGLEQWLGECSVQGDLDPRGRSP